MTDNYPPFSVSQYTTYPLTFEEDVTLYRNLGVEGIEVCEEKLSTDQGKAKEQLAMLRESGLRVTSVQPRFHSPFPHKDTAAGDPQTPVERFAHMRRTIDLFSEAFPGENIPLVTGGGIAPDSNFRLAHQTARQLYPDLADYARDRGIRLMFEHLHPVFMNAYTFIVTLDEALTLIEDIDRPNFGLGLDLWHVWHERDIVERIAGLGALIFGVHIGDYPKGHPRCLADRVLPGDGVIDLPALLDATDRTGYRGAYCLELFSDEKLADSLWKQDPARVVREGREGFRRAWKAGVSCRKESP